MTLSGARGIKVPGPGFARVARTPIHPGRRPSPRGRGYRVLPARRAVLHPCPREGGALSNSLLKKGLFPASVQGRLKTQRGPASEEAGQIDPDGSGVAAAGPDQVEAVVTLAFHQRGIDRRRKTRMVELDREIFAIAVPRGLLPGGAAFDGTCDDPIVGRLVVVLFGRDELCPEVERERLDRSAVAVVRRDESADGSHGGLPLLSGRANRSLDGGPWPE